MSYFFPIHLFDICDIEYKFTRKRTSDLQLYKEKMTYYIR